MARPSKQGLEYFPFDTDFFSDLKVRKVKKTCGAQSVAVLLHILCTIYRNGYYIPWSDDSSFLIAEELGVDETEVERILQRCFEVDFLSERMYREHHVLTSHGIQRRYIYICRSIRRVCQMTEYCLISSVKTPVSSEETPNIAEETPANLFQNGNSSAASPVISSVKTPVSSEETPNIAEETPNNFGKNTLYKIKENKISSSYSSLAEDSTTTRNFSSSPGGKKTGRDYAGELRANRVPEDDILELQRLCNNFEEEHVGTRTVQRWLLAPTSCAYYVVLQTLQQLEDKEAIKVSMPRTLSHTLRYLNHHLKPSDYTVAVALIQSDKRMFAECTGLIKDCKNGKIKQPGAFIMSRLNKYRQQIQTT